MMWMWEQAFELASRISNPDTIAVFGLVIACAVLAAYKKRKPLLAYLVFAIAIILGLAPLIATTYIKTRGVYNIRIVVLLPNGKPTGDAELSSSAGGEIKKTDKNWEYELPPQIKPADGNVSLFASMPDAYLHGKQDVKLGDDFYLKAAIQLAPLTSVEIRGVVVDSGGHSIPEAMISEIGYPAIARTDRMGNFSVQSHGAAGQLVQLRAEKGATMAQVSAIAGKTVQIVLR